MKIIQSGLFLIFFIIFLFCISLSGDLFFTKRGSLDSSFDNEMIHIPAGEFIIGDRIKGNKIYIKKYYIDRFEVTNEKYKKFIDATGRDVPMDKNKGDQSDTGMYVKMYGWENGHYPPLKKNFPVNYVDWNDADAYCLWVKKRLPTENEWEKAARGTDGRNWPWGDKFIDEVTNTTSSGFNNTSPVDFFPSGVSPYGIFDMAGNVWEWCDGWYSSIKEKYFTEEGEKEEKMRVIRGGSWDSDPSYSLTYTRLPAMSTLKKRTIGFRCAKN